MLAGKWAWIDAFIRNSRYTLGMGHDFLIFQQLMELSSSPKKKSILYLLYLPLYNEETHAGTPTTVKMFCVKLIQKTEQK